MAMVECSIEDVPLRRGKERSFTVLTNIVPNALHVSLEGIRPGLNAWRYYLEKAESVTLKVQFTSLEGAPLISKQVRLEDCNRDLGPHHRTQGDVREYANFELLDWKEHSDLQSNVLHLPGYKVGLQILEDGGGGKREGKLLYDYWLHYSNRHTNFSGTISRGETFRREFDRFEFVLEPLEHGWFINVYEKGREESLSRFTRPLHGPNPCLVEGWHFRNAANTGPNTGELNLPQKARVFHFSPEVGRTIQSYGIVEPITEKDLRRIQLFGVGILEIKSLELSPPSGDGMARIEQMSFSCRLEYRN